MGLEGAIYDFLRFLRKPSYAWKQEQPLPFWTLTAMYAIVFLLILIVASPLMYLVGVDSMEHSIDDLLGNYPKWVFVLLTVVVAPIAEEVIFRWHLRQPLVAAVIIFLSLFGGLYALYNASMLAVYPSIILAIFLCFLMMLVLGSKDFRYGLRRLYLSKFHWIFYITTLLFALAHISNFSDIERWYIAPILVLPQAFIGLFLGYVRGRNNIFWSIYFHAFHNLIPTLLFLFIPMDT